MARARKHVRLVRGGGFNGRMSRKRAKKYGNELFRLEEKYGRGLKPGEIVEEARSRRSPLHDFFEWNDGVAAEKYRLSQARQLVAVVRITVLDQDNRPIPIRSMTSVHEIAAGMNVRRYVRTDKAINIPRFRYQAIVQAFDDMMAWMRRNEIYQELGPLVEKVRKAVHDEHARIFGKKKAK